MGGHGVRWRLTTSLLFTCVGTGLTISLVQFACRPLMVSTWTPSQVAIRGDLVLSPRDPSYTATSNVPMSLLAPLDTLVGTDRRRIA